MSLNIENEYGEIRVPDYEHVIETVIGQALDFIKCPYECEIYVLLTDNSGIQTINNCQRNINAPTDVLSFPMFEKEELENKINSQDFEHEDVLGDIVISIDRVKEQAKEYGHSFEREFAYMIVHGFYHLMGYDHIKEEDKAIMRPKEEKVLNKLGITREDMNE